MSAIYVEQWSCDSRFVNSDIDQHMFLYTRLMTRGRGIPGVHRNLVVALNIQWTSFTAKSRFQMTTTKHGFLMFLYTRLFTRGRGISGVHRNLVVTLNVQWTSFTAKSKFQLTTTKHGFTLKSGFKNIWWPQNMVSVLNQVSLKYCVHETFLKALI